MSGLFGSKPPVTPPPVMPDPQSPEIIAANRQAQLKAMARGGRSSTILTQGGAGGDTYSSSKTG